MSRIKAGFPIPPVRKSKNWETLFLVSYIILTMLYGAFHIGRNYERDFVPAGESYGQAHAHAEGYEEGFVSLAEDVKRNFGCVYPTDACLKAFENITDY